MPKYKCLLIPDWLGNGEKNGVESGPKILNEAVLSCDQKIGKFFLKDFFPDSPVIIPVPDNPPFFHRGGLYEKSKYLPEIEEVCKKTKKEILKIIEEKKIPIILMGDDSSLIGVLSGILEKNSNNFGLIYFDAHADINTPDTSPSGCVFGMPLAYLININKQSREFNMESSFLYGQNITMIGARSFDKSEPEFIKEFGIKLYPPEEVNEYSAKKLCDEILNYYSEKEINKFFIHIDLDVIDPSESVGTLLLEPDGIKSKKITDLISYLTAKSTNLGLSISEYNPLLDKDKKTLEIALNILRGYIENSY